MELALIRMSSEDESNYTLFYFTLLIDTLHLIFAMIFPSLLLFILCYSLPLNSFSIRSQNHHGKVNGAIHDRSQKTFTLLSQSAIVEEWNHEKNRLERVIQLSSKQIISLPLSESSSHQSFSTFSGSQSLQSLFKRVFLPVGYPSTVPEEYKTFQMYNLLQGFCSYLRNIMSTHAIFISIGVGRKDSQALTATLQWILRDGISMIVGLIFTSINSQQFGINIKSWRLFADFINNIGITFDMIAPYFPSRGLFLLIISLGSICKCLCGITAGATGVAIYQYFSAKHNNLSDILSKSHAQRTIISLLGLVLTMVLTNCITWFEKAFVTFLSIEKANRGFAETFLFRLFQSDGTAASAELALRKLQTVMTWGSYSILTIIHMICNYRLVKILALNTLNPSRYSILLENFFCLPSVQHLLASDITHDKIPLSHLHNDSEEFSPKAIASQEPVISPLIPSFLRTMMERSTNFHVKAFISLKEAEELYGKDFPALLQQSFTLYSREKYVILFPTSADDHSQVNLSLLFSGEASGIYQAKAFFEVALLKKYYSLHGNDLMKMKEALPHLRRLIDSLFPKFWTTLEENNWNVEGIQLQPLRSFTYSMK